MLVLSSAACREKAKVAQASRSLADSITKSSNAQGQAEKPNGDIEESRVYLDATLSMAGFANQNSTYDDLLDELGNALPGVRVYKFGQKGQTAPPRVADLITPAGFGLEIHRPKFYDLTYNPDDRLISFLAAEERPVRSVLITDGVYSEAAGSTAPPVVTAIQEWMNKGRAFGILVFRSPFSGPFYSERARSMQPSINVKDRPFYAFVFSPTDDGLKELKERLERRFQNSMQTILFASAPGETVINLPEKVKASYAKASPPGANYYWQMFGDDLFGRENRVPVGFNVKVAPPPGHPATEFKLDVVADYYRWNRREFTKVEEGPPRGFDYDFGGGSKQPNGDATPTGQSDGRADASGGGKQGGAAADSSATLTVYLPKDTGSDYGFYHLKLVPTVKELRPEISSMSTRDDRAVKDANKTFRFFEFIDALTNVHFKNRLAPRVSPAIFVTVDNR